MPPISLQHQNHDQHLKTSSSHTSATNPSWSSSGHECTTMLHINSTSAGSCPTPCHCCSSHSTYWSVTCTSDHPNCTTWNLYQPTAQPNVPSLLTCCSVSPSIWILSCKHNPIHNSDCSRTYTLDPARRVCTHNHVQIDWAPASDTQSSWLTSVRAPSTDRIKFLCHSS